MRTLIFWLAIALMLGLGSYNFLVAGNFKDFSESEMIASQVEEEPQEALISEADITANLVGTWSGYERYAYVDHIQEVEGKMSYYSNGSFDKRVTYKLYETRYENEFIEMSDKVKKDNKVRVSGVRIKGRWSPNQDGRGWIETTITCSEEVSYTRDKIRNKHLACDLQEPGVERLYGIYDTEFGQSNVENHSKYFVTFNLQDVRFEDHNYSQYRRLEFDPSKEFDPDELETQLAKEKQAREAERRRRWPKKTGNPLLDSNRSGETGNKYINESNKQKTGNPIIDDNISGETGNIFLDNNEIRLQIDGRESKLKLSPLESSPIRSQEERNRLLLENNRERNKRILEANKKKSGG